MRILHNTYTVHCVIHLASRLNKALKNKRVPGALALERVHDVQVHGRLLLGHATGKEHDAGYGGGYVALKHFDSLARNLLGADGLGAVCAGAGHGGLEQRSLKVHAVVGAGLVHGSQDLLLFRVGGKGQMRQELRK